MNAFKLAHLTDNQRFKYAEEHRWLPCPDRYAWPLYVQEWWSRCRELRWPHVRGVVRRGRVLVKAASVIVGRRFGDDIRQIKHRLAELDVPGEFFVVGLETMEIRGVTISEMPDVVGVLERLLVLHDADVAARGR